MTSSSPEHPAGSHTANESPQPKAGLVKEALLLWAASFGGLVAAKLIGFAIPFVGRQLKAVAAGLFLYLPGLGMRRRDETVDDFGVPDWPWRSATAAASFKRDLKWGFGVSALLIVPVVGGFLLTLELIPRLPDGFRDLIMPYSSSGQFALRLPDRMWLHVLDQVLVVSLPEEFFYRGYLQTRLKQAWGSGGRWLLLGVPVGAAFWLTQGLFAVGHLAEFYPWRLAVFFPAILFGWLRERTGSIGPGIIVHAFSNLLLLTLETSAFGP